MLSTINKQCLRCTIRRFKTPSILVFTIGPLVGNIHGLFLALDKFLRGVIPLQHSAAGGRRFIGQFAVFKFGTGIEAGAGYIRTGTHVAYPRCVMEHIDIGNRFFTRLETVHKILPVQFVQRAARLFFRLTTAVVREGDNLVSPPVHAEQAFGTIEHNAGVPSSSCGFHTRLLKVSR